MRKFEYVIDFDERGSFAASVRDSEDKVVFSFKAGDLLEEGESSIFEDGFMKHDEDVEGLEEYLKSLGIISKEDSLIYIK